MMTIVEKIRAIISSANAKTGENDGNLTDAVKSLIEGFGSGDGSSSIPYISGEFIGDSTNRMVISHPFGTAKIFAFYVPDGDYVASANGKRTISMLWNPSAWVDEVSCDFSSYNSVISNPYTYLVENTWILGRGGPNSTGTSLSDNRYENNNGYVTEESVIFESYSVGQKYRYYIYDLSGNVSTGDDPALLALSEQLLEVI